MTITRLLHTWAFVLAAGLASAANVEERSPFAQGHWWNPAKPGSGFDIFNVGAQSMVIWYTYEAGGRPVWYTAQGTTGDNAAWPLLRHRWVDGGKAAPTQAGTLKLTVRNPESLEIAWQVGGASGATSIEPFITSGVRNEVDRTGSWYDPANSGWGFALTDQGEVLGGVLFTYDAAGEPTWAAGFGRERDAVELHTFTGACPSCAYAAPQSRSVGRLGIDFHSETELTLADRLSMAMAPGTRVDGARLKQLSRPASTRAADRQLAAFASTAALRAYLDAGMMNVRPGSGGADFSAAPPAPTYSPTNLQEEGVDEPDHVKSNGRLVYTFAHGQYGQRIPTVRVAVAGHGGWTLDLRGSVELSLPPTASLASAGLFVHGDRLVAVTGTQPSYYGWSYSGPWTRGTTQVEILDAATPNELPVSLWRAEIEGHVLSSRLVGQRLYVVSRYVPYVEGFSYGSTWEPAATRNRELLAWTPLEALLPKLRVNGTQAVPLVQASTIHVPPQGSRAPLADMILVTAIDLEALRVADTLAILGSTEAVYASPGNLYLASTRHVVRDNTGRLLPERHATLTDIHRVSLAGGALRVADSGTVEGVLSGDQEKAPFRMGEHDGRLRVVSTSGLWWGPNTNRVTILEPSAAAPGLLKTVSWLPNARRPEPLGKPHEMLYGTRFVGERLYAVTFKKTDPLYVVDLADRADPRIAGELEIPGFSDYLHPLPNGLLLGFGKDAVPASTMGDGQWAWFQGLQLTLFDVSDAGKPREVQRMLLGKRGSESALLRSHHAFSLLPRADGSATLAFPARIHDGIPTSGSGPTAYYPWKESGLVRVELRGTGAADARLEALPGLVTHRPTTPASYPPADDGSWSSARAVQFQNGVVYVSGGKFWHRDEVGTVTGPF